MRGQEIENVALNRFMEDYFYSTFRSIEKLDRDTKAIELIFYTDCPLNCEYCYLRKYEDIFHYPKKGLILENLDKILNWYKDNKFQNPIALYSGEILVPDDERMAIIEYIYQFFKQDMLRPRIISMPTNMSFLRHEELTKRIEDYIYKFKELGIRFTLSASIDGKYYDDNRSNHAGQNYRDDAYYDKLFEFCKKHNINFHGMIYYGEHFDDSEKNLDWWFDMMRKYDFDPNFALHQLEVRNDGWTRQDAKRFGQYCDYVFDKFWNEVANRDRTTMLDIMYTKLSCANIGSSCIHKSTYGYSCALQGEMSINVQDLSVYPCHRLMFNKYKIGHFDNDMNLIADNIAIAFTTYGSSYRMQPICIDCPISELCHGGCLGAQLEATGDMFTPVQSVCWIEFEKVKSFVRKMVEFDIFDEIYNQSDNLNKEQLMYVKELLEENE